MTTRPTVALEPPPTPAGYDQYMQPLEPSEECLDILRVLEGFDQLAHKDKSWLAIAAAICQAVGLPDINPEDDEAADPFPMHEGGK